MDNSPNLYKRKVDNNEDTEADTSGDESKNEQEGTASKKRQYNSSYSSLGFKIVTINGSERPMCELCEPMKVLPSRSLRPTILKRHLVTLHPEHAEKLDEFQRESHETNIQEQTSKNILSVKQNELASYHVSYRIGKYKLEHTIGETLLLPAIAELVRIMFGESYAQRLENVSLDDNEVGRKINEISDDIFDQLISRLRTSKFAVQVDNNSHLIVYVRYVAENNIFEDILFCKPILGNATSIEIFNLIDWFFEENDIPWNNCVGLCTDGAHSMSEQKAGFQALVEKKAPHAIWTHSMLHTADLVSKNMSEELNIIFIKVVEVINYILESPFRVKLLSKLCVGMGENYVTLLNYCEFRWLSRAEAIQKIFELRVEIATFLEKNQHEEAHLWKNNIFIVKLAYLVEIFGKLSRLNKSLQGSNMNPFVQIEKVTAFIKKLKLWKSNLENNKLNMFSVLKDFWATADIEANKNLFLEHLDGLVVHFSNYFKDLDFSKFMWVQNPFNYNKEDEFELKTIETEKLMELSCDNSLKYKFQNETIIQFWMNLSGEYELLYCKAMEVLLPFVSSHLCETGFSALATLKVRNPNKIVEKELRVALSTLPPRFEKLCANIQEHPSH